jgi:Raf kinase inhibitor-like YbhB/YbcL family protein
MDMTLTSSAFKQGEPIPVKYTGDGPDVSPPLAWTNAPDGTQAFVLICDDPDAPVGTWVHWVLYDIPGTLTNLPERVATTPTVPETGTQGINDFRRLGYGGPAPPPGKPHRYFFKLYALDGPTGLPPKRSKKDVLRAIKGHILAEGQLMGTYKR